MQIHQKTLVLKVNSFGDNNEQVIYGNNVAGPHLIYPQM